MGNRTSSRQQLTSHQHSSENRPNIYQTKIRSYAKWEHGQVLASDDVNRVVSHGMQNLDKHKQLTTPIPIRIQSQIKSSRSTDDLLRIPTTVTAEQLLYGRSRSSSEMSIQSTQSANHSKTRTKRKKVPRDVTFVSINPKDLQNIREIGRGNFGTVYHALYNNTEHVAIKTLHIKDIEKSVESSSIDLDKSMHELLNEAYIMTRLKHPNVLRFVGVTFLGENRQLSLVTDFMKNGSLFDYLRKKREMFLKSDSMIVTNKLNSFARQIFEAMIYLEEKKIIHRDLATRNCLIGENNTLKVADFGLTTLTDCGLYKGTYRSICAPRWTSPEAVFQSKYSSRSDVWSYGITLWEIYSLGDRPFGNMSNFAVKLILKNSSENLSRHFPKPEQFMSDATYTHIILPCLTYNVTMRPRFKDLRERLVTILIDSHQ